MPDYKFNIFSILSQLTSKQEQFFDSLSDEDIKDLHPLILMRWMSGTSNKLQVMLLNEIANPLIFPLYTHKRLLLKILMVCAAQTTTQYKWIKPHSPSAKLSESVKVIGEYFNYSKRKAQSAVKLISVNDIISMAEELGYQKTDIEKIRNEHKSAKTKIAKTKTTNSSS